MKPITPLLRFAAALLALSILPLTHGATVRLTYQDNSTNETGFKLERATGSGGFSQIATIPQNVETYDDTTVVAGTTYSYRVRSYNSAGNSAYSNTATVTANDRPTITAITDRTINIGTNTGPIAFTLGDVNGNLNTLALTAASSNTVLVPVANIVFAGTGANRTITVTPVATQDGTSVITITVSDGQLTAQTTFSLTVITPPPSAPTTLSVESI